jgi:hypothetical protein
MKLKRRAVMEAIYIDQCVSQSRQCAQALDDPALLSAVWEYAPMANGGLQRKS